MDSRSSVRASQPLSVDTQHSSNNRSGESVPERSSDWATSSFSGRIRNQDLGSSSFYSRNAGEVATPDKRASPDLDPEVYSAGQSLASILNNPHLGRAGVYSSDSSWGGWFFSSASADVQDPVPSTPLKPIPEVSKLDFKLYLDAVSEPYNKFADVLEHSNLEKNANKDSVLALKDIGDGEGTPHGEGLIACLREIPSLYFKEDFALEDGGTFQVACPYSSIPENMILQEKLSHYLDIIEFHLVREIEARSESFYEAQGQLEDLNSEITKACEQIQQLKATVTLSEVHVVESAKRIQSLSEQRESLLLLHRKLNLMSYVNQALGDLPLLVAAADCGGALDVIDVLQNLLASGELVGFHSFRHLGTRLSSFMETVNSMLAADFVRIAIHDTKDLDASIIVAKFRKRDVSYVLDTKEELLFEEDNEKEEAEGIKDQLLPLVIGLLRTSKLPAVLRIYRDTLVTDIKAAVKVVVAELLSVLISRPIDTETQSAERQSDIEGASLASKLRSLTAENFVQLLTAIFDAIQVRLRRAAEIRKIIEQILEGLQGSYAEAAVAAAFASGAAAAAAAEASQEDHLQSVLSSHLGKSNSSSYGLPLSRGIEAASPTTITRNFRADVLTENTEAVCSACNAAQERWAKLLSVRTLIHPKLRLPEFVSIYNITQVFMFATEKIGGRYASSVRGTLQSQSKSFVDVQHNMRMSKISAVLEQETWVTVDAPDEFQAILDLFTHNEDVTSDTSPKEAAVDTDYSNNAVTTVNETLPGNPDVPQRTFSGDVTNLQSSYHNSDGVANGVGTKPSKNTPSLHSEDSTVADGAIKSKKSRDKPTVKTLQIRDVKFHMVNSGLILLKMISEYVQISDALPSFAAEVVHRVVDLLKAFNARTCQLVLGAGAMQVSGLKSITAKHLALASQSISFFHTLITDLKRLLLVHVPDARKTLLLTEIENVSQDYKVHRDEIHLKLVQIMKERLMVHLRTFPQVAETWIRSDEQDTQPSSFARALTKEVGVLHRVLSPLLLESDVQFIFTRVVALFHSQLVESFSKLDLSSAPVKQRLYYDIQHILTCIRGLPSNLVDANGQQSPADLDEFLKQRYN